MSDQKPMLPNADGIKQLRELYKTRKAARKSKYNELADALKKKDPVKKIAKEADISDLDF